MVEFVRWRDPRVRKRQEDNEKMKVVRQKERVKAEKVSNCEKRSTDNARGARSEETKLRVG